MITKKTTIRIIILVAGIFVLAVSLLFGYVLNISCKNISPSHGDGPHGPVYFPPPSPSSPCRILNIFFTMGNTRASVLSTTQANISNPDNSYIDTLLHVREELHPISIADFTKDDILMGTSHNIFIARVIKQSGEKALGASPETQFQVEIIDNIKGELKGTVTVNQFGGYQNGTLVTIEDDHEGTTEQGNTDPYLLKPGQTYLLATRYHEGENWYTVITSSYGKKLLSTNTNANTTDLKSIAQNDERVQALIAAYPNEKLLDADIQHHNTRNNYKDREAEMESKQTVPNSIDPSPPETATDVAPPLLRE